MTGRELKALVATIDDDAEVLVSGPDSGGYDVTPCRNAEIQREWTGPTDPPAWRGTLLFQGVGEVE